MVSITFDYSIKLHIVNILQSKDAMQTILESHLKTNLDTIQALHEIQAHENANHSFQYIFNLQLLLQF